MVVMVTSKSIILHSLIKTIIINQDDTVHPDGVHEWIY
jgi:hypothetical protein